MPSLPPHVHKVIEPDESITEEDVARILGPELWARFDDYPHQRQMLLRIVQLDGRALLAGEPGTGKSPCGIANCKIYDKPGAQFLFVTTKSMIGEIEVEIEKWWPEYQKSDLQLIESPWNPRLPVSPLIAKGKRGDRHHPHCPPGKKRSAKQRAAEAEASLTCECGLLDEEDLTRYHTQVDSLKTRPVCKLNLITHGQFVRQFQWVSSIPWEGLVFDESQVALRPTAQVTKCLLYLGQRIRRCLLMTGTVMCKNNLDLFVPFCVLQPRLYEKEEHFAMKYCKWKDQTFTNGKSMRVPYGGINSEELGRTARHYIMIRVTKADIDANRAKLGLPPLIPPKHRGVVYLDLEPENLEVCKKQIKEWEAMKETMKQEAESGSGKRVDPDQWILDGYAHLVQDDDADLPPPSTDEKDAAAPPRMDMRDKGLYSRMLTHAARMKRTMLETYLHTELERVVGQEKKKVLLWAHRKTTLAMIKTIVDSHHWNYITIDGNSSRKQRREAIKKFESPESTYQVAVLSIMAAKEGITLVKAEHAYFCECLPVARHMLQAEDRLYRIGQKKETYIRYMVLRGTIDEIEFNLMRTKVVNALLVVDQKKTTPKLWCPEARPAPEPPTEADGPAPGRLAGAEPAPGPLPDDDQGEELPMNPFLDCINVPVVAVPSLKRPSSTSKIPIWAQPKAGQSTPAARPTPPPLPPMARMVPKTPIATSASLSLLSSPFGLKRPTPPSMLPLPPAKRWLAATPHPMTATPFAAACSRLQQPPATVKPPVVAPVNTTPFLLQARVTAFEVQKRRLNAMCQPAKRPAPSPSPLGLGVRGDLQIPPLYAQPRGPPSAAVDCSPVPKAYLPSTGWRPSPSFGH